MAQQPELQGSKPKDAAARSEDPLSERDLDKVSGGVNKETTTTTPPSGPIPIPYPDRA
jgi:hypothetical protein